MLVQSVFCELERSPILVTASRASGAITDITVHSVVAPSGELRGKGRCGVFAGKTGDPHLSALEVRFSR